MTNNEGAIITGTTLLTATSWASANQPWFSIAASCATVIIVIFGIANYLRKWKREQKN
jgi:hypothetical protein